MNHLPTIPSALIAVAVTLFELSSTSTADETAKIEVVGYMPDYRMEQFGPETARYLSNLVYFSAEATADGELNFDRLDDKSLEKLQAAKKRQPLKLSLTVGGWERSAGFARLAASSTTRQRFATNCIEFCKRHDFDGIDLDWEHPANDAESRNYSTLIAELKRAFAPHELRLSVAIADWQMLSPEAIMAVDRIHLMAYDAPHRHSTFDHAKSAVARLRKHGTPSAKICLGIPFYGRGIEDSSRSLTYAEILAKYRPASSIDEVNGIYFNGQDMVERKTRWAIEEKLAGVMIWEIGQDASDDVSLQRAIHRAAIGP